MSIKPAKVGIVGAGNVGAAIANTLVLLGKPMSIVLFDRNLLKAEGQAWDISDAIPLLAEMDVMPSARYDDLADADIIVVTVGVPNRPGQTRLDSLNANTAIVCSLVQELDRVAPHAIVIIVSNPVDVLTRIAIETSMRSPHLIFGSGTVLDTARLQYQLGKVLNVDKNDVHIPVIGEHGESQFPVWSTAVIGMIPLTEFPLPRGTSLEQIQAELSQVTRDRGKDILERKGHTSYGVATVVAQLIDAILRDEHRMFTVSTKADLTYGLGDKVVLGLPCIIGRHGIERCLVLPRNEVEQTQLEASATKLQEVYQAAFWKNKPCYSDLRTVA